MVTLCTTEVPFEILRMRAILNHRSGLTARMTRSCVPSTYNDNHIWHTHVTCEYV